ncbi:hypothetical protein EUTSA_v10000190mg [Eutrema salsugineum]|uniref:F-box domain-containing protein n=1 Tax=Eutrema salsugineum TaxID=72664 RepID=V4NJ31_EUTSA|nr:F-box protein At2g21930 [Eutrema salsugineum]ESQ46286.1 hypothetical protein EUTSA_v10000190mg [Eutrema salsugineum]
MERQKAKLAKKKISDDVRTSEGDSDSIPLDLIQDILKGLPVKTLARFLCVSKPWASIIRNRDFVKSYLTKSSSSTHPQSLIFTFKSKRQGEYYFFSSSQPQNGDESCVASYHMKCHSQPYTAISPSVHGLICYGPPSKLMVYNPSTRRSIALPKIDSHRIRMYHFLGYDPIDGDYKMLCMSRAMHVRRGRGLAQKIQVLTLGNGNSWRMIENCPPHSPESPHICIDGVLYYGAYFDTSTRLLRKDHAVMRFDVRSENFDLIKIPPERATKFTKMTRYNGKLALMFSIGFCDYSGLIELWVLVDAAKHEWSSKIFALPRLAGLKTMFQVFCAIDDDAGEFVLAPENLRAPPFYVLYYDPKKNSLRKVNIEGITENKLQSWANASDRRTISIFPGQVENLMFF